MTHTFNPLIGGPSDEKFPTEEVKGMPVTKYAVNWDNGAEACGTFPQRFDTEEAAQKFADDWVADMMSTADLQPDPDWEGYSAEVIEVQELTEEEQEASAYNNERLRY